MARGRQRRVDGPAGTGAECAGLAFDDPTLRDQATVGVLISAVLATLLGWAAFRAAAVFRGQTDADLPRVLDRPVDPERDHVRGPVDAPLTLVEYGDFECPFCARNTGVIDELREGFGDELRYVFRHLPLVDVHPHAELAARAAVAAQAQGRFWEMHDALYANGGHFSDSDLRGLADRIGLDTERFGADLATAVPATRVARDADAARTAGITATPAFFVNGRMIDGAQPFDAFKRVIDEELAR